MYLFTKELTPEGELNGENIKMKTSQEQILKALSGLIPEDAQTEVCSSVSTFLESTYEELHAQFEAKLKESYAEHQAELEKERAEGEAGYAQAWEIITDLRDRLELQKEEMEQETLKGYEEAYQMLQEERAKNDTLEVDLYEEYDKRFNEVKDFLVEKLDQFLQVEGPKYYERAKRDVLNDPAVVEHKLAFEEMLNIAAKYLSDEDQSFATSAKVENLTKQLEAVKNQSKVLESKNMRLSMENTKLNEAVRQNQEMINEQINLEKKARAERAKKVQGRGDLNVDRQRANKEVILGEHAGEPVAEHKMESVSLSQQGEKIVDEWTYLSGQSDVEDDTI